MARWTNPLRRLSPITQHPSASPSVSPATRSATSSLSPAPSDLTLLLTEAEIKAETTTYRARSLLLAFLAHLRGDGRSTFAADILACRDEKQLVQLANHVLDAILKPFVLSGGKAPHVTTPPTDGADEAVDAAVGEITSSTRDQQAALRRDCLRRDGYRCVYTGACDVRSFMSGLVDPPGGAFCVTECAHILPFALCDFNEHNAHETRNAALIWFALHRYFPELAAKIGPETINDPSNAMMLAQEVHSNFGLGCLAFEPLEEPNRYRAINLLGRDFLSPSKTKSDIIEFTTCDPTVRNPDPDFLTTHLIVSRILHVSGLGQEIRSVADEADLRLDYHKLHPSGSTDVETILGQLFLTTVSASAGDTGPGHSDDSVCIEERQ